MKINVTLTKRELQALAYLANCHGERELGVKLLQVLREVKK